MRTTGKNESIVVSALSARTGFGKLLRALVIKKRGTPKAVLLSIREPEVLKRIGEESQRHGTDKLTSRQIDQVIRMSRAKKSVLVPPEAG